MSHPFNADNPGGPGADNPGGPGHPAGPVRGTDPVQPAGTAPHTGGASQATGADGYPLDGRLSQDNRNLGQIIGDLGQDLSTLMRQELALAKAELTDTAKKAGTGAGMFVGAAIGGFMVLVFLSLALWWVIGRGIGTPAEPALAASGLIVALIWAVIAAILALVGRSQLKKAQGVPQTQETVSKIPNALKGDEEENR